MDGDFLRLLGDHVLARDDHVAFATIFERKNRTDLDFDDLGRTLTDLDAQQIAEVHRDGLVHLVARKTQRRRRDDAAERDDCNLSRTTTDVDNHRTRRFGDRQIGAHCSSHGLFDEISLTSARLDGSLEHSALLDGRGTARDADDDARLGLPRVLARRGFVDECRDHSLGHIVVGNNAVFQRMLSRESVGRMVNHVLRFVADSQDAMR